MQKAPVNRQGLLSFLKKNVFFRPSRAGERKTTVFFVPAGLAKEKPRFFSSRELQGKKKLGFCIGEISMLCCAECVSAKRIMNYECLIRNS
jgi:hypothetical protein